MKWHSEYGDRKLREADETQRAAMAYQEWKRKLTFGDFLFSVYKNPNYPLGYWGLSRSQSTDSRART